MTAGVRLYAFSEAESAIVVLIGLPGAGKSFLCQSLLESRGWEVVPGPGASGRWWLAPVTLLVHPLVSILAFAVASTRRPWDVHRFRHAVRVVRKYDGIRGLQERGIVVVDEGPFHALLNIMFGSSPTWLSRPLARCLVRLIVRRPTLFLHLDIGTQACLRNARQRHKPGSWFNRDMSEDMANRFLSDRSYDEILEALKRIAPEKVHRFSSVPDALNFLTQLPNTGVALARPGNGNHDRQVRAARPC